MNLLNLPDEVLMIILKQLDARSLYNLHTTCDRIRNIIRSYGVIKTCNLSLSVISKAETLKSTFFQDISRTLQELNISGVCDLSKTVLLPAIKRMKCLNTLDVTYTNITICDFIELYKSCPTIKDISINYSFKLKSGGYLGLTLDKYQEVFKNLLYVHFVSNIDILHSQLPCEMLKKAKLKKLQYTVNSEHQDVCVARKRDILPPILHFDHFIIYYYFSKENFIMHNIIPLNKLDLKNYETIMITTKKHCNIKPVCYGTRIFENFFSQNCNLHQNVEFRILNNLMIRLENNVLIMLWNKSGTQFDTEFFSNLWCKLKRFLVCYFDCPSNTPLAPDYDLYVTSHENKYKINKTPETGFKRKRIDVPTCVLNYDSIFREKKELKLALMFKSNVASPVTLSSSCDYLKKLTYLSISGNGLVRYCSGFFNVLFKCCNNLITLRVEASPVSPCSAAIAQSLPLNQSIKNFHLIDRNIDIQTLFSSMSQCKMLENVHIFDTVGSAKFPDLSVLLENCKNLYCLYLYIHSSPNTLGKFKGMLKKINQKQTTVKLLLNKGLLWDPYSEVFHLNVLGYNSKEIMIMSV